MVGKSLSHYKILGELGRGGMGIVYKAEDTKLDRTVAIKVLPSAALASEDDRARFYREAKAAAQLHHPHIASVFEIDEAVPAGSMDDDLRPFIVMEFIDGDSLYSRIKEGPLKLDEAVRIATEIADALKAAHSKDIVHRDIKSANVMLTGEGTAKVLDFGLAKTAQSTKLTRMGSTLGTVSYMSPQQARVEEVDHRTDLWSLGVLMYGMISGRLPFGAEYEQAVLYGILNEDPEPLTAIRTGVPLELERIVLKCLSKDLKTRYQHADDLIADLSGVDTRAVSQITPNILATAPTKRPGRTFWSFAVGILTGAVASVALTALLISNDSSQDAPRVLSMNRVTIESVVEMWPSINPEANQIVYGAGQINDMRLYYRLIEGGPPNRLIDGMEASQSYPSYSPDGNQVLFTFEGSIYTVESLGGSPRPVVRSREREIYSTPAWSPSGEKIAFTTNQDSIIVHNLSENQRDLSIYLDKPHSPSWSPNGQHIALVSVNLTHARTGTNVAPTSIWIMRVSDGELYQVTSNEYMDLSPIWSPDGRHFYYVSNQGGGVDVYRQEFFSFGTPPGPVQRLTTGLNLHSIDLSKDGQRLIGGSLRYSQNIWSVPLDAEEIVSARDAIAVTTGDQIIEGVVVSPDGTQIAFDSNARGISHIFVMSLAGGIPFQITSGLEPDYVYDWSPYSDELSFHTFVAGSRDVYTVSISDLSESLISDDVSHDRYPVWLGDANTIGFHRGTVRDQEFLIAKRSDDGSWGEAELLIPNLALGAQWSPVNKALIYDLDGKIFILDPASGDARAVEGLSEINAEVPIWSIDGQTIYFFSVGEYGTEGFWSVPRIGGEAKQIMSLDGREIGIGTIAVDEHSLYFTLTDVESDIWVIEFGE